MVETLYRSRHGSELRGAPHPGLLFERFPRLMTTAGPRYDIVKRERQAWLDHFIDRTRGPNPHLARHHARMDALLRARGGQQRLFVTVGRLAIGLGNPNAGDIGFSLDHATGLPVIPGSSVKGLVAAGARCLGEEKQVLRILGEGPEPDDAFAGNIGVIAFLDAHPVIWPPAGGSGFDIDIITRHHDPESFSRKKTPLDADEPNPVHFLVVREGVPFVFRMVPLGPDTDLDAAWRWLTVALERLGAGGKTAVGYGEMAPADDAGSRGVRGAPQRPILDQARDLARRIAKNNAANLVPELLAMLEDDPGAAAVLSEVIRSLDARWVRNKAAKGTDWAKRLLAAASGGQS